MLKILKNFSERNNLSVHAETQHPSFKDFIGQKLHFVADFFFPRFCIVCGVRVDDVVGGYLCVGCFSKVLLHGGNGCRFCGLPCANPSVKDFVCSQCRELKPHFDFGANLFAFNEVGRQLVHTLKYHSGFFLKRDIQTLFRKHARFAEFLYDSALVPVPLHFCRLWKRGFNQSEWIADRLSEITACPVRCLLKRKRYTRTQTSLTRTARKQNVNGAFVVSKKFLLSQKQRYILIDDVYTTGATLNACAKALKEAGAGSVGIFTLGHG